MRERVGCSVVEFDDTLHEARLALVASKSANYRSFDLSTRPRRGTIQETPSVLLREFINTRRYQNGTATRTGR